VEVLRTEGRTMEGAQSGGATFIGLRGEGGRVRPDGGKGSSLPALEGGWGLASGGGGIELVLRFKMLPNLI
jgi:hypothetical protein